MQREKVTVAARMLCVVEKQAIPIGRLESDLEGYGDN